MKNLWQSIVKIANQFISHNQPALDKLKALDEEAKHNGR